MLKVIHFYYYYHQNIKSSHPNSSLLQWWVVVRWAILWRPHHPNTSTHLVLHLLPFPQQLSQTHLHRTNFILHILCWGLFGNEYEWGHGGSSRFMYNITHNILHWTPRSRQCKYLFILYHLYTMLLHKI